MVICYIVFLSPLSNTREDDYGGSEKRMKYPLSVIQAIKAEIPDDFHFLCVFLLLMVLKGLANV